jgi:hypothetical protein
MPSTPPELGRPGREGETSAPRHAEAYRHTVLDAIKAQVDVTLAELSDLLRRDLGACFAPSTL